MRPSASLNEAIENRPRKLSLADQISQSNERPASSPIAFFLARGEDFENENDDRPPPRKQDKSYQTSTLEETLNEAQGPQASKRKIPQTAEQDLQSPRRRGSTIKASSLESRRPSSIHSNAPSLRPDESSTTPPLIPSQEPSLPSSPKSTSSRSLNRESSSGDENSSQAIVSSEDDDQELPSAIQDSAPQLIMPSIKMPSRRPFTVRGKNMGRCKILVAGCKGSGKTSLIKSIVQLCEDIVHVDPLTASNPSLPTTSDRTTVTRQPTTEIHASTKPYPTWWSDVDESRILRRRKSMGDSVLERNLCFVEAGNTEKVETVIQYLEQQLQRAIHSTSSATSDFIGLLSGRGGSQVDVVLYLMSHETFQTDCERIKQLSEIANVVPLLTKSDLQSPEDITNLKSRATQAQLPGALPKLPVFPAQDPAVESSTLISATATSPYTISAIPGPDNENMDASLLMSPEYVQPLLLTELSLLVSQLFDPAVLAFLRHTAAKKLVSWHVTHPRLLDLREQSPSAPSLRLHSSTLNSPILTSSMTNSGVLVPLSTQSELSSLSPSTSYALARVADHTQREERLAHVRLTKWAADLQVSLQRERERYERIARGERAIWLVERMGEELGSGNVDPGALVRAKNFDKEGIDGDIIYTVHDPLGLLKWQDALRTRGWIALQVVGSFGVVGGLVVWAVRTLNWNALVGDGWAEWVEGWREW